MHAKRLSPEEARASLDAGDVVLIDVRPSAEFARRHVPDSVNVPFSEKGLADRIAIAVSAGSRLLLVDSDERELASAARQVQAGAFQLLGVIDSIEAWAGAGQPTRSIEEVAVSQLAGRDGVLVDVREPFEWEMGYVAGARFMPLSSFREHLSELSPDESITIICEAGIRSSTAASMLLAEGYTRVAHVPEGMRGYRRSGQPLAFPEGSAV